MTTYTTPHTASMDLTASTSTDNLKDTTSLSPTTTGNASDVDIGDFLHQKNLEFVASLIPTIAFLVFIMVFGVVGNTVVFVVYYRRFQPSVTRVYILAMAVCDFLTNVLAIPLQLLEIRYNATFYVTAACKAIRSGSTVLIIFTAVVLVAVAMDRQKMICNDRPGSGLPVRTAYRAVWISALISVLVAIPYSVLAGDQAKTFPDSNITGVTCSFADKYVNTAFPLTYVAVLTLIYIVCVTIMVVSYVRIARHLWQHKKATTSLALQSRRGGPGSNVKEVPARTSLMLFVLTVVFIINYLSTVIVLIMDEVDPQTTMENLEKNARFIFLRTYYINSAVNPVVYSFVSVKFRHECRSLFGCKSRYT